MSVPGYMIINTPVKAFDLTFNAGQNLLVLTVLLSISAIESGEEPHDRPADTRDKDRHPPRFHPASVPERLVSLTSRQLAVNEVRLSELLGDRQNGGDAG